MNATHRTALLHGVELYRQMAGSVDDRTLDIVERRRRTARVKGRGWLVRRMLLAADLVGLVAAFAVAEAATGVGIGDNVGRQAEIFLFLATVPAWIVVTKLYGLYDHDEERTDHSTIDDFAGVFHMVTGCTSTFAASAYLTGLAHPSGEKLVLFWFTAIALISLLRVAARALARRNIAYLQNTIIVGAGDVGQLVARKLLQHPEYGINLVGFVDDAPKERRADLGHLTVVGTRDQLPALIRLLHIERVIVAFSHESHVETLDLIRELRRLAVQIDLVPRLFEIVGPNVGIHTIEGLPLVGLPPAKISRSSRAIKRAIDLAGAAAGLVLTAPLFAYAAWRIKRESPGGVFFRQPRLGMDMQEFTALKFRTMRAGAEESMHRDFIKATMSAAAAPNANGIYKLDREDAVTPFGRWLRKTSLDELPQLINVLRGEMSLVGPRPCIPYEVENFAPHHFERFLVPAGLTGLWQVTARAHSTFGEALDMDVAYARSWSLRLDLTLLLKTPLQIVHARGTA